MNKFNSRKNLLNSTLVYFVGIFCSKLLQFFILPVLTSSLNPSEFGFYDSVIALSTLIVPLLTFQAIEGMFRFTINSNESYKKKVITNVNYILIFSGVIMLLLTYITNLYLELDWITIILIYLYFISNMYYLFFQKISRSRGLNKLFAISGVVYTFILIILQVVILKFTNYGVNGLILANFISTSIMVVFYFYKLKISKTIDFSSPDKKILFEIFNYSLPLIPNNLSWWGITTFNTFIVIYFIGIDSNGLLAVSNKFPGILTLVTSVFQLAWQETAIRDSEENQQSNLFSQTFNTYFKLLSTTVILSLIITKIIFPFLVEKEFNQAINYTPFLFYSAVFSSICSFLGVTYTTTKNTKLAFFTTIYGFVFNFAFVLIFINLIGIYAAVLGKMISFLIVSLLRIKDAKKLSNLLLDVENWKGILFINLLGLLIFYSADGYVFYFSTFIIGIVFIKINSKETKKILLIISNKILRRIK